MHSTQFVRDKSVMPSSFTLKIRKHIRTRRVEKIEQLGVDRVVDFTFGEGDKAYHIIVEFYAKGNLILTDHEYKIIVLLRAHKKSDEAVYAVGETYPTARKRQFTPMTREKLLGLLERYASGEQEEEEEEESDEEEEKKVDTKDADTLKMVLNNNLDYGPGFAEHCILTAGLKPNLKLQGDIHKLITDQEVDKLVSAFREADDFILHAQSQVSRGWIILQPGKKGKKEEPKAITEEIETPTSAVSDTELALKIKQEELERENAEKERVRAIYDDFAPFMFKQFEGREAVAFESFDSAVDEFFSALEARKLDSQKSQIEKSVMKKLDKIKTEQQQRIEELQQTQEQFNKKAALIEENLTDVDEAIEIICSAVAQAYDWEEIRRIIKEQKKEGNKIAKMIQNLKLETNQITLLLNSAINPLPQPVQIDVDISLSAYANAQKYYEVKKKSADKQNKTVEASKRAIKVAEKKSVESLKQQQIKSEIVQMRKRLWFEKFNWFITSENYLVLSGRDAQQNELLVKRYMRRGDIYVHADVHGASTCIVKNPTPDVPVPPLSLQEAGMMTVCRSAAWDNKIVTNAWWVYDNQVSKSAPTGEYLPTGSFMIRGKKNFLPPSPLVLGLSVMFYVDESCIPNHLSERKVRTAGGDDDLDFRDEQEEEMYKRTKKWTERLAEDQEEDEEEPVQQVTQKVEKLAVAEQPTTEQVTVDEPAQESSESDQDQNDEESKTEEGTGKPKTRISAKDRRRIKQLKSKGVSEEEATEMVMKEEAEQKELKSKKPQQKTRKDLLQDLEEKQTEEKEKPEPTNTVPDHKPQGMKKGKWKKLKKKYGDQDDDERKLRMELLGHRYLTPDERQKEKEEEERKQLEEKLKRQQKEEKMKKKEIEEIKKILEDESIPYMDDEDREKLTELDALTGEPREDDIILFGVPVCAPYSSMKSYKYKVKVLPGGQKRGKSAKIGMNLLAAESKTVEKESNVVKSIPEVEVTAVMVGNARIASTTKLMQSAHKKKK
jgi:predicted ribosome quality control (RQC) complex YloA/Tae2 family protein